MTDERISITLIISGRVYSITSIKGTFQEFLENAMFDTEEPITEDLKLALRNSYRKGSKSTISLIPRMRGEEQPHAQYFIGEDDGKVDSVEHSGKMEIVSANRAA